jgi:hypothetical protein
MLYTPYTDVLHSHAIHSFAALTAGSAFCPKSAGAYVYPAVHTADSAVLPLEFLVLHCIRVLGFKGLA